MIAGNKISTKALMLLGIFITILDAILANMSDKKYIAMHITEKNNSFLKLLSCVYNVYPPKIRIYYNWLDYILKFSNIQLFIDFFRFLIDPM